METLTSQWYNALAAQLKLDTQQFQMVQGNIALGSTSAGMWAMMDSIPPDSITQYWTPQGYKSFSSQYGLVLTRLHDPSTASFEAKMGEYLPEWMSYLEKATIPQGTTLPAFFRAWALTHMAPDLAQECYSLLTNALNGPVGEGAAAWAEAGGSRGVKAYNQSISTVEHTVSGAPSASVSLDSATESSDTSTTWAKGSTGGFFDIFFGEAGASYEKSTVVVSEAGVVVSVQFAHMTGIPVMPLAQGTIVSGPNTYQAWYVPAALSLAYGTNNYDVWDTGSPGWASFFGESGSFPRAATQLLLVDGITVSVTSHQAIAEESRAELETSFEAGFFPFFGIEGHGGWTTDQRFNDAGQITATASCAEGDPQVLGVLQRPIGNLLAAELVNETRRASRVGVDAAPQQFEHSATVAVGDDEEALVGVVYVAWSATAQMGLRALGVKPAIEQLIVGFVNTWATNNAPAWGLGGVHQYEGGPPAYVATAEVISVIGKNRTVTITEFH